ncbi:MAG: DUF1398 family protein [Pedobacter sp.]|nr:DUF1398 family protein [Pedobacter sp.]MDQ8051982.1 DUF1398 family protein [Pedobacter sp.]
MFTLEEINNALKEVKTGADFPAFAAKLRSMGVKRNDVYVMNGMAIYFGSGDETIESAPVYENLLIAAQSDPASFQDSLKAHQIGETDFFTFCRQAADAGVEKWIIDLTEGATRYLDMSGNEVFVEKIPF